MLGEKCWNYRPTGLLKAIDLCCSQNEHLNGVFWSDAAYTSYLEDKKRFTPVSSLNSELKSKLMVWLEEPIIDDTSSKDLEN